MDTQSMALDKRRKRKISPGVDFDRLHSRLQVAQEVFGLSRVVRTFGTEEREVKRYKRWLQALRDINIRQAFAYLMYLVAASSLFNLTKVGALHGTYPHNFLTQN